MILVTGVNGLLGSALVATLAKGSFCGVDLGEQKNAYLGAYRYLACDLTDAERTRAMLDELRPKTVLHAAAMTQVDRCQAAPEQAWLVNVDATRALASWCKKNGARLIYISTDYVFDGVSGDYDEASAIGPLGVYAMTKAAGELAVRSIVEDYVIARTSVPYGPFAHVQKDFVRWLREELGAGRPVRIVTDQISNPTWILDLARMLSLIAARPEVRGIVHTTGAESLSRYDFAQRIARVFELDAKLIAAIVSADLKQASPRPMNASVRVDRAKALGLEPLGVEQSLGALKGAEREMWR